jgi:environmental stress-induced protein Ves
LGEILHLRAADARRVPWKNGRGFTDELAIWPPGASFERGEFDWRISKAAVEEDGPFSSFPGFERVLVVTEGAGLVLDHGAAAPRARVERLVPYRFSGDWPTRAELVDGRIADFNVICRRGAAHAEVEVQPAGAQRRIAAARAEHLFVHDLASGESLWLEACAGRELELPAAGTALLVRIREIRAQGAT